MSNLKKITKAISEMQVAKSLVFSSFFFLLLLLFAHFAKFAIQTHRFGTL